tara:strand:+ start:404 stop:1060 length:657 start_codon:yes stop_codon:yes gene_type:complete
MKFRIAKVSDYKQIAELHYNVRERYSRGFFSKMGKLFLNQYYKIILNDPNEVVLCAVDERGILCGFTSGTINVEEQFTNLRKNSFSLLIASIPSIILNPKLIFEIWERYQFSKGKSKEKFVTASGARGEFWVWGSNNKQSIWSPILNEKQLQILYVLGVKNYGIEVDVENDKILLFSKKHGADEVERVISDEGKERVLLNYDIKNRYIFKRNKNKRKL